MKQMIEKIKQEVFLRLNHHELQRIPTALIYEFLYYKYESKYEKKRDSIT